MSGKFCFLLETLLKQMATLLLLLHWDVDLAGLWPVYALIRFNCRDDGY